MHPHLAPDDDSATPQPTDERRVLFDSLDTSDRGLQASTRRLLKLDGYNRRTTAIRGVRDCCTHRPQKGEALWTCDLYRLCVFCGVYEADRRAKFLTTVVGQAPDVLALTLTRANRSAPLADEWRDLYRVRLRFTKRGDWSSFQKRHGIDGVVIAIEVVRSHGAWSPHVHVILTFSHKLNARARREALDALVRRWLVAVEHEGQHASPRAQHGTWVPKGSDRGRAVAYACKGALAHAGSAGHLMPGGLLERAAAGDRAAEQDWQEYTAAVRNLSVPPIHQYGKRISPTSTTRVTEGKRPAA